MTETEEINYLGQMLTATKSEDCKRLKAIICRLIQIETKEKLDLAIEALEYYACGSNWSGDMVTEPYKFIEIDESDLFIDNYNQIVGGKLARETLTKIKG